MNLLKNLLKLFKEIILVIRLRSFYVKRVFIPDMARIFQGVQIVTPIDWLRSHYKVRKIVKSKRDEKRFGWVVWYV